MAEQTGAGVTPLDSDAQAAFTFIAAANREHLIYELFGIFWVWAELLILVAVRTGARTYAGRPAAGWRAAIAVCTLLGALAACALGFIHHGADAAIAATIPSNDAEALAGLYASLTRTHLTVWSLFVAGWVVLESLIVWQGTLAYRSFAGLCRAALRPAAVACGALAAAGLANYAAAQDMAAGPLLSALHDAESQLQPLRNAVYLYLRLAGVVWISVEWVAALLLWRGQALLWRVVRQELPHA